jgi:phosphoribosylpyrophosphate synthetase
VNSGFPIFTGNANPTLAARIARELGAQLSSCVVDRYPDGDVAVELLDSVRRKEVFLVQRTSGSRRCLPPRWGLAHYSNRALLRLRPGR